MKLFARPGSPHAQKVLVAAQYAGASVDVVTDAKAAELKGKAAVDRLPLLETEKGSLFESNAIMRFLAAGKTELVGKDAFEVAQIDSWCDFGLNEIDVPAAMVVNPIIGYAENYPEVSKQAMKDLMAALTTLDAYLKQETFLVGRAITLADISLATSLVLPMKLVLDDKVRKTIPSVTRWFTTCVNQPEFLKVVGPVTLVKKAVKAKGEAKGAAAPAKKAEKPAAAASDVPDPLAEPVKAKNPLDLLPKSKFILDEWKRVFSNSRDDYYKSMVWFWDNVDLEGYSIFISKYNYNDELTVGFQASNLIGGFIQRCDAIRKYAFGAVALIGSEAEKKMEIEGCWLMRGQDEKPILEANPDAEYHTWIKIATPVSEEDKKKIADLWCAEESIAGKPIIDSKTFK
mmetsp:Transcript_10311/g.18172  ORF Transcript_10311/g.18172 Transcript_10311/m.18172 type:complete len:401 (+) Transcript_10311:101-1303(+)